MKANTDPSRLDVAALAAAGGTLAGERSLAHFPRLADMSATAGPAGANDVRWAARGEQRARQAAPPEIWLHLHAQANVRLTCQRCLAPMDQPLELDRALRFAASEAEAEALDAEMEEDVLVLPRRLDLIELIEDELLLALPLVPMHAHCPVPLVASGAEAAADEAPAAHPFAVLKAWKAPGTEH